MRVILTQNVPKLGEKDQVIEVRDGYGRNYLIPQGLAIEATPGALRALKERLELKKAREKRDQEEAKRLADLIGSTTFTIAAKVGEQGKLFGSITSQDVAELISAKIGSELDRRKVDLEEPIKSVGVYEVPVKLHHDVVVKAKIEVSGQEPGE